MILRHVRSEEKARSLFSNRHLALTGIGPVSEPSRDPALVPQLDHTRGASSEFVNLPLEPWPSSSQPEVEHPSGGTPLSAVNRTSASRDATHTTVIPSQPPGSSLSNIAPPGFFGLPNAVNFQDPDWFPVVSNRPNDEPHHQVDISNPVSGRQRQRWPLHPEGEDEPESTPQCSATPRDPDSYASEKPSLESSDHAPIDTATLIKRLAKGAVAQLAAATLKEKSDRSSMSVSDDASSQLPRERDRSENRPLDNSERWRMQVRDEPIHELDQSHHAPLQKQSEFGLQHITTVNNTAELQVERALHAVLEQLRLHGQQTHSEKHPRSTEDSEDSGQQNGFQCDECTKTFKRRSLLK